MKPVENRINARVRRVNEAPLRAAKDGGRYVLYWMTANRRPSWNHALDRALHHAKELDQPVFVFEPLRVGYRWANDRIHRFVMDGMRDHAEAFEKANVRYFPYVEREEGQGAGLLQALAASASVVVTDDWPHFFLPRMLRAAAKKLDVCLEAVDSVGLWPVWGGPKGFDKPFSRAFDFRRFLQKNLAEQLPDVPQGRPWRGYDHDKARLPAGIADRWPEATVGWLQDEESLAELPIDHDVPPAATRGGIREARRFLKTFLERHLDGYHDQRNDVSQPTTSGLSPFLHFGHLSSHEILAGIAQREGWSPAKAGATGPKSAGAREGWWGMGSGAEAFLDQLVTWRELGFHRSAWDADFGEYAGLPDWARATLAEHADDARPETYTLRPFERAETHDDLWNAAQRQLLQEGIIHNYLRMLWGKKILHWSKSPEEAFRIMVHLNNKYAIDGRDPNSMSGISWVLGLFDRAWGPERPVFGKIRYMSSDNTRRKLKVKPYLERYGAESSESLFS